MGEKASNYTYFTQQALQAGYLKPSDLDSRTRSEMREAILREMEKERIREEIIVSEISRRRTAEEERYLRSPAVEEMSLEERLGRLAAARRGL